jgi:hypothetical protein
MNRCAVRIVLVTIVSLVLGSSAALAQVENQEGCGIVGTWILRQANGNALDAVVGRGSKVTQGQLEASWVVWDPTVASRFPAVRTTDPKGVWERVDETRVNTTWVAYGLAANGTPLYVIRARGFVTFEGCDQAVFTTTLDLFLPSHDIWRDAPLVSLGPDAWTAKRMPVVQ